jgi:integrase
VQVKSGRKYVVQDTDASFATTIEKTHLETWRTANLPVVLIVYHPADDKIYWKEIKPYLKATPDVFREPCRVHFDKAKDELTDKCRDRFAAMVDNSPPRVAADQKERLYTNLLLVKRSLRAAGKDADNFAGHSLRAGLATAAAMAGVSERAIQEQTGHKSLAMLRRYIRAGSLFRENAAAKIGL